MSILGLFAYAWASLAAGTAATVWWRSRRRPASRSAVRTLVLKAPGPLLVRPCAGREPQLRACLLSIARARTSTPWAIRVAVETQEDPAWPVADEAARELRRLGFDADVMVTDAAGANRKVDQIWRVVEASPHELVAWADSTVDLSGIDLDAWIQPLVEDPTIGAIWSPPVERTPRRTLGDRGVEGLLASSLHAFPLLARIDRGGFVGKLVATRTSILEQVHFSDLTGVLGEDLELGRRVRSLGRRVLASADPVVARPPTRTFREAMDRTTRWIAVIRAQRPALLLAYPLFLFSTPAILLLAILAAPAQPALATAAAVLGLGSRVLCAYGADRAARSRRSGWQLAGDALLGDVLLVLAFVRALGTRQVHWRGRALQVGSDGLLTEVAAVDAVARTGRST